MNPNREACCFTGHRRIAMNELRQIKLQLEIHIAEMLNRGVTDFITGGAIGFDMLAARAIARRKAEGKAYA